MSRCYALVYLRISSTDVDVLRLLSILGEMERVGTTMREMERPLLRNDGVFPPLLDSGKWCKTAKPPCFTKSGPEPQNAYIQKFATEPQGVLHQMKDAVIALGKHDDLLPSPLQELAPPALPADRLTPPVLALTLQPICGGQREHQQREQDMHSHRALSFLGRMPQFPLLLGFLDAAVLNQTAVVIVIKRPQGLVHRGVGQEDHFACWAIVPTMPLAHHHGIDRVGSKVPAVALAPTLRCAILVVGGQPGDAQDLGLPPLGPRRSALPMTGGMHMATDGDLFPRGRLRSCVRR